MKEFIEKLIGRLEELYARNDKTKKMAYEEQDWEKFDLFTHRNEGVYASISIVNQLAEEYKQCNKPSCKDCEVYDTEKHYCPKWCDVIKNTTRELAEEYKDNDFCEWGYDEFEEKWQTDCGVLFALHDSDREITNFCPCCGREIKVVE